MGFRYHGTDVGFLYDRAQSFPARSFVFNERRRNDYQGVLKEANYGFEIPADKKTITRRPFGGLRRILDGLLKKMSNLLAGFLRVVDGNLCGFLGAFGHVLTGIFGGAVREMIDLLGAIGGSNR